jgi:GPH family glycoside/pentoside/hexuronide:cation symporter
LRREGLLGAIYWWMVKVGYGIAGGLSGAMIAYVGFNPDLATVDQQSAVDGLHGFFCFFPAVGTIIAMWIMSDYDLTEDKAKEIRDQLEERRA